MAAIDEPIVLTPSPKAFFRQYAIGIILSPALVGLYLIWKTELKRRSIYYRIGNQMLTIVEGKYSRNIDFETINDIQVRHGSLKGGVVTVLTPNRDYSLIGLKEADRIAGLLLDMIRQTGKDQK